MTLVFGGVRGRGEGLCVEFRGFGMPCILHPLPI